MKVREIMTTPVISVEAQAPVAHVAALLRQHAISAVPITDDAGAVVGVVSEYDLIARSGSTARDIMSPGVISANEDTDVDDVRALLVDRRIRRVPVMAGSALVGIVSRSDIVALMAMEWVCQVCGEPVHGARPPEQCPRCGAASDRFVEQQTPPGD
jgi:CBS domain-containing protein